jgi:hypothetical protein
MIANVPASLVPQSQSERFESPMKSNFGGIRCATVVPGPAPAGTAIKHGPFAGLRLN